jgi:zinc transporter ZupT
MLLIVLSVHSVILGLALDAQSAVSGAVIVFLAIVAHKGATGFALGVGYARAGFSRRYALPQVVFFSTMTPLGILVGASASMALTVPAGRPFEAIFDSLGAGTFIYIAALDIIKTDFDSPEHRTQKWFAAALAFGIMALLAIWL